MKRRSNWQRASAGALRVAPRAARSWILLPTSVTRRIEQVTGQPIRVTVLHDGRGALQPEERRALGAYRPAGHVREVVLQAGTHAVLVARSVWALNSERGSARLRELGNRPLGALLFVHGNPEWLWREFAHLALGQDLCNRLAAGYRTFRGMHSAHGVGPWQHSHALNGFPRSGCWARRTLYVWEGVPILVLEAFLPALLAASRDSDDRPSRFMPAAVLKTDA